MLCLPELRVTVQRTPRFRWFVLGSVALAFLFWTWKLVEPKPVPEALMGELKSLSEWVPFVLAKCLHLLGNAFFAAAIWLVIPSQRWRWIALSVLLLHGMSTEIGQTFVPNRTGSLRDVAIDWCGVMLGWSFCRWAGRSRTSLPGDE